MRKGLFVTEPLTDKKISQIINLGANEISLGWHNYATDTVTQLRELGIKVFAEIGLFSGKDLWKKYPDARPIDRAGNLMEPIHWYHGVCPNHPGVRQEKLAQIENIISSLEIDGLWLDFIRYPCHWEEVRDADLTEYCFCEHCRSKFAADVGGPMQGKRWIQWKCDQVSAFVESVHRIILASGKPIELGIFAVPWRATDFGGAIKHIIGQDFQLLSQFVDLFGVMAYHQYTGNQPQWIHSVVHEIALETDGKVMPLVQSMDVPQQVTPEEFSTALKSGIRPPSQGVMVFHFEDMVQQPGKTKIVKHYFSR